MRYPRYERIRIASFMSRLAQIRYIGILHGTMGVKVRMINYFVHSKIESDLSLYPYCLRRQSGIDRLSLQILA
jgi:hypothetical protein